MRTIEPLRTAASLHHAVTDPTHPTFLLWPRHSGAPPSITTLSEEDEKWVLESASSLIAVGAILTWAVNASVSGLELQTIGVILMVVGALGLVLSMIFWSSWGGVCRRAAPHDDLRRGRPARTSSPRKMGIRESGCPSRKDP